MSRMLGRNPRRHVHHVMRRLRKWLFTAVGLIVSAAFVNLVLPGGPIFPRRSIVLFFGHHLILTIVVGVVVAAVFLEGFVDWWMHRNEVSPELLAAAKVRPADKLHFGINTSGGGPVDLRLPVWPPPAELDTPAGKSARETLAATRGVVIRGAPSAGKTHIAGRLLRECGNRLVIMPHQTGNNPPKGLASLEGRDVVLFLDDLHEHIETFDPLPWWDGLREACGDDHVQLIAPCALATTGSACGRNSRRSCETLATSASSTSPCSRTLRTRRPAPDWG